MKRPAAAPKSLKRPAASAEDDGSKATAAEGDGGKILRAYHEFYKRDDTFGIKLLVQGSKKREVMKVG